MKSGRDDVFDIRVGRTVLQREELDDLTDNPLTEDYATRLHDNVNELEGTLESELIGLQAYTVTQTRYDSN